MKRIIALLLVAVMMLPMFAACNKDTESDATDANETDAPATDAPSTDDEGNKNDAPDVEAAKDFLKAAVLQGSSSLSKKVSFDLPAQVTTGDLVYTVEWVSSVEAITIAASATAGFVTVTLPTTNAEELAYTLTATVKYGDESAQLVINCVLPVIEESVSVGGDLKADTAYKFFIAQVNLKQYLYVTATGDGQYISTTTDATAAPDFFAEVVDGGYKFYTKVDGATKYLNATVEKREGEENKYDRKLTFTDTTDSVWYYKANTNAWYVKVDGAEYVLGNYNTYNTLSLSESRHLTEANTGKDQFPAGFIVEANIASLPAFKDPDPIEKTIAEFIDIASKLEQNATTNPQKYVITGTVKEIKSEQYGNLIITDGNGKDIYIYGTYSADGKTAYNALEVKPVVGDTVKLVGVASYYDGPQMKSGWILEHTPAQGGSDDGDDSNDNADTDLSIVITTAPVAGTNYAIGLINTKVSTTDVYYISGGMAATYYLATSKTLADAKVVGVEDTTGGYHLYVMIDAAKKYINVSTSGTHVNANYEDTASTVWTWDDTVKTLVTDVSGSSYALGTSSSNSYTTLGPVKTSGSFIAQLYGITSASANASDTDGDVTIDTDGGESEETVYTTTAPSMNGFVKPEVGTAYKFGMVQGKAGKVLYLAGGMSGYYMATTENILKAIDVYVEETEGGYYLYTMNDDTKVYINMVVSGTYVNGAYAETAATVYKWNGSLNTFVAVVNGTDYIFGTRNDNTYLTVGPCKASFSPFYTQFVTGATEMTIEQARYQLSDTKVVVTGVVIQVSDDVTWISDGEYSIACKLATSVELGDYITVTGFAVGYSGMMIDEGAIAVEADVTPIGKLTEVSDAKTVAITGKIVAISDSGIVTISDGTNTTYACYLGGTYNVGDPVIVVGKVATVLGIKVISYGATAIVLDASHTFDISSLSTGTGANAYIDRESDDGWKVTSARIDKPDNAPATAITLNGKTTAVGTITSPTLAGGISKLTFKYCNNFSESNGVSLTISIKQKGVTVATTTLVKTKADVTKNTPYDFSWTLDSAIEGDFVIEISNNSPSNSSSSNKDRVSIWDITWYEAI